jgi:hypothetical protein
VSCWHLAQSPSLSAVRHCLLNVCAATFHNWRPFLHPQPDDTDTILNSTILETVDGMLKGMQTRHPTNLQLHTLRESARQGKKARNCSKWGQWAGEGLTSGLVDNKRPIHWGTYNLESATPQRHYFHLTFATTPNEAPVTSRLCILVRQLQLLHERAVYLKQSGLK